jgi:hypothetical protein
VKKQKLGIRQGFQRLPAAVRYGIGLDGEYRSKAQLAARHWGATACNRGCEQENVTGKPTV